MYSELGLVGNYAVVQCSYYFKVLNTPIIWIIYTVYSVVTFHLTSLMVHHHFVQS